MGKAHGRDPRAAGREPVNPAASWKQLTDISRLQWGRLVAAGRARSARKASQEQFVEWLAREHKRDPIHK